MEDRLPRKLAVVLHADVAGYSRLAGEDEDTTHRRLKESLGLISQTVISYHGRVINTAGDAVLAMFEAIVDAVSCAAAIQHDLAILNQDIPDERKLLFRIGVNLGDVIEDSGDIFGDGVNVAARIEGLAEPGGICIAESVYTALGTKLPLDFEDIGAQSVKNIVEPIRAYQVHLKPGAELPRPSEHHKSVEPSKARRWQPITAALVIVLIVAGGGLTWLKPSEPKEEPASVERKAVPLPDKPSIAVLPFTNMSGDPDQEYFSDGITEDLTTDLSKISGLFVVARNSSFAYKDTSLDLRQVSRDLGVKYILEGSVRRIGDQIRINAQLINGTTGGHVWAERFDGTMTDVFSLQDEVNQKIIAALAIKLTVDDHERLSQIDTSNPDAYDMLLRGLEQYQRFSLETTAESRDMFKQAIKMDPNYARAYANVALTYASDVNFNWTNNRKESIRLGLEYTAKALELDDNIPQIYQVRSILYLAQRKHDAAIEAARRTLEVHPNYADGHATLAFILLFAGQLEEALEAIQQAKYIDPRYSYIYLGVEGRILFHLRQYQAALQVLEESVQRNPVFDRTQLNLAATHAQLGDLDNAAWAVDEALSIRSDITLADERLDANYKYPQDLDLYIEALRKAGVPEL